MNRENKIKSTVNDLDTWVYDYLLDLGAKFKAWFFLKNLDLAKTLLLGLEEIGRGTLKILTCLGSILAVSSITFFKGI